MHTQDLFPDTIPPKSPRSYSIPEVKIITVRETPAPAIRAMDRPELLNAFLRETVLPSPGYRDGQEQMIVVMLDTRLNLAGWLIVSLGTINECMAEPRDILRPVLISNAFSFVIAHNHPSGDPTPSDADRRVTIRINEAAKLLRINMLDHIIIGEPAAGRREYFSFRETGLL